jgi:hypothetical protein
VECTPAASSHTSGPSSLLFQSRDEHKHSYVAARTTIPDRFPSPDVDESAFLRATRRAAAILMHQIDCTLCVTSRAAQAAAKHKGKFQSR